MTACESAHAEHAWIEQRLARPSATAQWRIWNYERPAVVLGCSQRRLLAGVRATAEVDVLARRSGGGAVLVGPWMLGLSIALPVGHAFLTPKLVASYRWVGKLLAAVLRDGGAETLAVPPATDQAPTPDSELDWACFGRVSPWEVVARGRKIAGLSQVRSRHAVLFAAAVLLQDPDWNLLCNAMGRPLDEATSLMQLTTSMAREGCADKAYSWLRLALEDRLRTVLHEGSRIDAQDPRACENR